MRRTATVILTAALALASPAAGLDLDSLLIKSVGGPKARQAILGMTSYHAEGTVDLNGLIGKFREVYAAPNRFYLDVRFDQFSIVQGYDGQTAWQKDQNGKVAKLSGPEEKDMLRNIYFESFSFLVPGRLPGSIEYKGPVTFRGQVYHEIAFHPFNADTVPVYFDVETGQRKVMLSKQDNLNLYTYIDRIDTVNGICVAASTTTVGENIPYRATFTTDRVALNEPVDTTIFRMPSTASGDFRFPEGKDRVVIPVEYKLGHLRVPVIINGSRAAWFILDSGASSNIFHRSAIGGLNLTKVGTIPTKGLSGFDEADLVKCDSMTIGELTLYNQVAGSLDLAMLSNPRDTSGLFGGLLGYDFLSRFPMLIDYRKGTLTVFDPDRFTPPDSGVAVPFTLSTQIPTVRAELIGIPGDFIVDLGNAYGLIIHQSFFDRNRLGEKLANIRENPGKFTGVGGSLPGRTAFAATFQIGDILIQSLQVILPDAGQGVTGSEALAGNIGNLILQNFRVLFDYNNSRLIFYDTDKYENGTRPTPGQRGQKTG